MAGLKVYFTSVTDHCRDPHPVRPGTRKLLAEVTDIDLTAIAFLHDRGRKARSPGCRGACSASSPASWSYEVNVQADYATGSKRLRRARREVRPDTYGTETMHVPAPRRA